MAASAQTKYSSLITIEISLYACLWEANGEVEEGSGPRQLFGGIPRVGSGRLVSFTRAK